MIRSRRLLRISVHSTAAALVVLSLTGCLKQLLFLGLLIHGPPSIEPDFDSRTGKSMTAKDVKVAVICEAPLELQHDFGKIDRELGKFLSFRLREHQITSVHHELVQAWIDENSQWDTPTELGAALKVTYVIHIEVEKYSLFEKNNQNLLRGRTEGLISVYEMSKDGTGKRIYTRDFRTQHPRLAPRSTYNTTPSTFKREYLSRLSDHLGWYFYEHHAGDDIPDAT
ncbi:MAG: hypothetical protein CMJ65_02710 [Planctomycetaceae bacterium]|jgi:hypothetical protein|nr:hypothetical protein [Planctomycetaceae bacterium]MDP7273851.1 hypothetical protein [Planctomycetaceae bacterium]